MKISIAMCTYNGSRYVQEQLDSILSQTRIPDELVICDDGSIDETLPILRKFANIAIFPVRIIVNPINLGSTKNFEKAIDECTGDIIVLADQDDVWMEEKLYKTEQTFASDTKIGAVFSDANIVDENLNSLGYRLWDACGFTSGMQHALQSGKQVEVLLNHRVVTGATMAFRSECKEMFAPIPDNWVHDGWIALLVAFNMNLEIIREPLILYRQHVAQQIGVKKQGFYKSFKASCKVQRDSYIIQSREYLEVLSRIMLLKKDPSLIEQVKDKITHLDVRANMPTGIIKKIFVIYNELITLRYFRYGNGLKSIAKDIFLC